MTAERFLSQAGVIDRETASMLLAKRLDLDEPQDSHVLRDAVEQLLLDKPYLRGIESHLPSKTASVRTNDVGTIGQLARIAQRAAQSGHRKDVAEYLRLRRQVAMADGG